MEYQRIHKLQQTRTGTMLSPSKLRLKLTTTTTTATSDDDQSLIHNNTTPLVLNVCNKKKHYQVKRADSASAAAVHPTRTTTTLVDDHQCNIHECDSTTSSSSFEFHNNGERLIRTSSRSQQLTRSFSRPSSSSKWNDAEKWIMTKPSTSPTSSKPLHRQNSKKQNKLFSTRMSLTKTVDSFDLNRFSFSQPHLDTNETQTDQSNGGKLIRAVSMRDMGTEMTPLASQEPSRTSTPMEATTPLYSSPTVSNPCTPERQHLSEEEELKMKTRREIIALGIQLGKKNIIATLTAEQEERLEHCAPQINKIKVSKSLSEFECRAAAWEQVEKTKHEARFKREEVMIQIWESRQKAKLEAEMRRIEAKVDEMKFKYQTKMLQKIESTRHQSEAKRTKAEAMKNQQAQTSATMADYIRRKGYIPYTYMCCGWT